MRSKVKPEAYFHKGKALKIWESAILYSRRQIEVAASGPSFLKVMHPGGQCSNKIVAQLMIIMQPRLAETLDLTYT